MYNKAYITYYKVELSLENHVVEKQPFRNIMPTLLSMVYEMIQGWLFYYLFFERRIWLTSIYVQKFDYSLIAWVF
jgi:hypothetical protein